MEAVTPIYEDTVSASFYNECCVAAVKAVVACSDAKLTALEIGAGVGGTASFILPVIKGQCKSYYFTDVSDGFMRQARVRFAEYGFLIYSLLNVDADPRLQGFASLQCDLIIATNVLHATPFMRNTLRNCSELFRAGGILVVNEVVANYKVWLNQ